MDPLDPVRAALLTDLHNLTLAAACWDHGVRDRATFELSFRRLPAGRGYILSAGAQPAARYLEGFRFEDDQILFARNLFALHHVRPELWEEVRGLRFTGDLWAPPEGTPVFADEPLLRVTAPLLEAQLVGTYLSSLVAYSSLVATKTARLVDAAAGRAIVDGGAAHCHGPAASLLAARSAYIAGAFGSTSVEAAQRLGVPIVTTMAPAFVLAFAGEEEAFRACTSVFPDSATIRLDTYEPLRAARTLVELRLPVRAVQIGTGDLAAIARAVRRILDEAGMEKVRILADGDLDEARIQELAESGAPIDQFVAGADLAVSADAPALDLAYDLVEIERGGAAVARLRRARDGQRATLPGTKQVYRRFGSDGTARGDTIALASEKQPGAPLLEPFVRDGVPLSGRPGLETARAYTQRALLALPAGVLRRTAPETYPVEPSPEIRDLRDRLTAEALL